ncbi:MAG: pseudouridine synthase, partial [Arenicellales bacterium]
MTDPTSETPETTRLEKQLIASEDGIKAIDLIAGNVPLSKQKIKMAMEKGAVWFKKAKGGRRRLRRAKTELNKGDSIEFNYDAHILASVVPVPQLIADKQGYSVWYKPELMLSQGSKFADHCAITRWVEKNIQPKRAVYLVHRLDRAASGLILIAHNQTSAAKLSRLFSDRKIQKRYT